jgi:hypothetical protein
VTEPQAVHVLVNEYTQCINRRIRRDLHLHHRVFRQVRIACEFDLQVVRGPIFQTSVDLHTRARRMRAYRLPHRHQLGRQQACVPRDQGRTRDPNSSYGTCLCVGSFVRIEDTHAEDSQECRRWC